MKSAEFFLKFTERYHVLLSNAHKLKLGWPPKKGTSNDTSKQSKLDKKFNRKIAEGKDNAHEFYRQFFGLMFDEFIAYNHHFLDKSTMAGARAAADGRYIRSLRRAISGRVERLETQSRVGSKFASFHCVHGCCSWNEPTGHNR